MRYLFSKVPKTILVYILLYIFFYLILGGILYLCNMTYLLWFKLFSFAFVVIGIIASTIQSTRTKSISCILFVVMEIFISVILLFGYLFFVSTEEIVERDGQRMIKASHSFLLSNWIKYYDYSNILIRSTQPRIYEAYDNTLHKSEYLYTIYYDDQGNKINK